MPVHPGRADRHRWWPIAPRCAGRGRTCSGRRCAGAAPAYLDSNAGDEPLEDGFPTGTGAGAGCSDEAAVLYEVRRRDGSEQALALRFRPDGERRAISSRAPAWRCRDTLWRVRRARPAARRWRPCGCRSTLEDTPFYARSLIAPGYSAAPLTMMHESLALDRFSANWVRLLLPFRMPRRR